MNRGGLEGLYRILLEDSSQELVAVLRHVKGEKCDEDLVLIENQQTVHCLVTLC